MLWTCFKTGIFNLEDLSAMCGIFLLLIGIFKQKGEIIAFSFGKT